MRVSQRSTAALGFAIAALAAVPLAAEASEPSEIRSMLPAIAEGVQITPRAVEVGRQRFQQYLTADCGVTCTLDFTRAPVSARLDVSNVSCLLQSQDTGGRIYSAQLLIVKPDGAFVSGATLVPTQFYEAGSFTHWSANHVVSLFANARQHFRVVIAFAGSDSNFIACHISGDLVTLG
jgi:hypothetical protein